MCLREPAPKSKFFVFGWVKHRFKQTLDRKMCCLCQIGHTLVFLYKFTSEKQKTDVLVELLVSNSQGVSLSDEITGLLMHDLASSSIVLSLHFKTLVLCPHSWVHHTVCETRRKIWSERWRKSLQVRHSKQTLSPIKLFWLKVLECLLQLLAVQANTHQVPTAADFRETAPSDVCGGTVISAIFKKGNSGPSVFNAIFIA